MHEIREYGRTHGMEEENRERKPKVRWKEGRSE